MSGIVWSFGILLIVMFFANLYGTHPQTSFWSNFERMDGYVSLVHTFLYMFVLGNVLQTKKHWSYLLNTSLAVAFIVAFYGLAQYGGLVEGAGSRIDSRLGNAAYMAVYMLFHIFIAFWLFVETRNITLRVIYGALSGMFIFVLIETGTRGTVIGFAVGVLVMSAYIGFFGTQFKEYRKYAVGGFAILAIVIAVFVAGRDSEVIQSNPNLARIANISSKDLEIRMIIWNAAWEGVKEKPLLGYGQSNFNYVFNDKYDPRLYAQEQWFDRAHNIFMDWLITGGFVGLVIYLSIFGWCLYYLLIKPLHKKDESFNVMERGVLLGVLAGYFTHNLVVFDNIVSYMFFAIILALITSRVGVIPDKVADFKIDKLIISQFLAPVAMIILALSIYTFHVPGMQASADVIDAFRAETPTESLAFFVKAVERNSFAQQEITEQLAQQAISVVRNEQIPVAVREAFATTSEAELLRLERDKPGDARIQVFIGSYYRAMNQLDKAEKHMALAREFSPKKQAIIIQQGFVALSQGRTSEAHQFFKDSFDLDERNLEAREYYAASFFYVDEPAGAQFLLEDEGGVSNKDDIIRRFAKSDFLIGAANQFGHSDFVIQLFDFRIRGEFPENVGWKKDPQNWATLAFLYYQNDDLETAVSILNEAKEVIPTFEDSANCFIDNIENDKDPQEGC